MRIDEASKLMEIPAKLISEIIDEHEIEVERYLNGNHDLSFEAMMTIYSVYDGSYRSTNHTKRITDWRQKVKVLNNKVNRLQKKIDKLESRKPEVIVNGTSEVKYLTTKPWYPRKKRSNAKRTV